MAVHPAACVLVVARKTTPLQLPPKLRASSAPPVVMSATNALCVRPAADGKGRSTAVSVISTQRRAPPSPAREEMVQQRTDRRQEMLKARSHSALSHTLRAPSCTELSSRTPLGRPKGRAARIAGSGRPKEQTSVPNGPQPLGRPEALFLGQLADTVLGLPT